MKYVQFGKTGLAASAIGLGCWSLARAPPDVGHQLVRQALDLGVTLFDTADNYGLGRSEEILGAALEGRRHHVVVATKVGNFGRGEGVTLAYSSPHEIFLCCDASLQRLRTDYIDLYQCHIADPPHEEVFLEAFSRLRERGKIRGFGISTGTVNGGKRRSVEVLRSFNAGGDCGLCQLEYNMTGRPDPITRKYDPTDSPETDLLPYCAGSGIGTLVRGPLLQGLLSGGYDPARDRAGHPTRGRWGEREQAARRDQLLQFVDQVRFLQRPDRTLGQAALQFVLAHPGVSVAIPGASRPEQLRANVAAAGAILSDGELRHIREVRAGINWL